MLLNQEIQKGLNSATQLFDLLGTSTFQVRYIEEIAFAGLFSQHTGFGFILRIHSRVLITLIPELFNFICGFTIMPTDHGTHAYQ